MVSLKILGRPLPPVLLMFPLFLVDPSVFASQICETERRIHSGTKTLKIGVLAQRSLEKNENDYMCIKSVCYFVQKEYNMELKKYGYEVVFEIKDSGCNSTLSIGAASELVSQQASAIIGPSCSDGCIPVALLATFTNKPMISFGCSSGDLSDKSVYPTFARTKPYARTVPVYLRKCRDSFCYQACTM